MSDEDVPERIPISHDDYHAKYVGRTHDGRLFFLTSPFCTGGPDFVALYLFDNDGNLVEARIDQLGSRTNPNLPGNMKQHDARDQQLLAQRLAWLGDVSFESIEVKPFAKKPKAFSWRRPTLGH